MHKNWGANFVLQGRFDFRKFTIRKTENQMKSFFITFIFLTIFYPVFSQTSDIGVPKDYTGEWINWYGNRQVKEKINYVNGKRLGKWTYYNSDGTIQTNANYVKGKKEGEVDFFSYYESGKIKQTWISINGKREGDFFNYYENGNVMTKGKYKHDVPTGKWKSFDENGKEIK